MPRFSIVIPTRDGGPTLGATLRTCLRQHFESCEILVVDNPRVAPVRDLVEGFGDRRLRHVRAPKPLAMTDNWEFAVDNACGEYVTVLGDDDGLVFGALHEIDRLIDELGARILQWHPARYYWPDIPAQSGFAANELLLPLCKMGIRHPVRARDSRRMIRRVANCEVSYADLPMIYCSFVHRDVLHSLRLRAGRVFGSRYPDIYSSFALGFACGDRYEAIDAPFTINALSAKSNGIATLSLANRSPVAEDFRSLNDRGRLDRDPRAPDVPLMRAAVADAFWHAKAALFPDDAELEIDRRRLIGSCAAELAVADEDHWRAALLGLRQTLADDPALVAWFDAEVAGRAFAPGADGEAAPKLERYTAGHLNLQGESFGLRDVFDAAELCEKLLGLERDGVKLLRVADDSAG
jgi:glycosyltransferase involved in cell wall biosynthesis